MGSLKVFLFCALVPSEFHPSVDCVLWYIRFQFLFIFYLAAGLGFMPHSSCTEISYSSIISALFNFVYRIFPKSLILLTDHLFMRIPHAFDNLFLHFFLFLGCSVHTLLLMHLFSS